MVIPQRITLFSSGVLQRERERGPCRRRSPFKMCGNQEGEERERERNRGAGRKRDTAMRGGRDPGREG